jgi:hypothetical protein
LAIIGPGEVDPVAQKSGNARVWRDDMVAVPPNKPEVPRCRHVTTLGANPRLRPPDNNGAGGIYPHASPQAGMGSPDSSAARTAGVRPQYRPDT